MKRIFVSICIVAALFFTGCGKKKQKKRDEIVAAAILDEDAQKLAQSKEIPVYQSDEEKFFDFDEGEGGKNFAFVADEDQAKENTTTAENKVVANDMWEDEDLTLAWEDEQEENNCDFKVVNFDLNKNEIRVDQEPIVAENVKRAEELTKTGRKLIVAGHCCPLGSASYNMSLSERRAKTIRDEMVKGGIPEEKVTILGCGSEHPIVLSNATDRIEKIKELAPNRRAEISVN